MKFINEKEIKQCISLLIMGKKLDVDPTEYLAQAVDRMNERKAQEKDRLRGN